MRVDLADHGSGNMNILLFVFRTAEESLAQACTVSRFILSLPRNLSMCVRSSKDDSRGAFSCLPHPGVIPPELGNLGALAKLDLSRNQFIGELSYDAQYPRVFCHAVDISNGRLRSMKKFYIFPVCPCCRPGSAPVGGVGSPEVLAAEREQAQW